MTTDHDHHLLNPLIGVETSGGFTLCYINMSKRKMTMSDNGIESGTRKWIMFGVHPHFELRELASAKNEGGNA